MERNTPHPTAFVLRDIYLVHTMRAQQKLGNRLKVAKVLKVANLILERVESINWLVGRYRDEINEIVDSRHHSVENRGCR